MALTSLPKSRSADTSTDFFRKVMGYRIYGTRVRFGYSPLLSLPFLPSPAISAVSTTPLLVLVTGMEVAKTDTRFWPLGTLGGIISLPVTVIALDLRDIFHFLFDVAGVNIRCRKVVAATTLLTLLAPRTSLLVVLVLFWIGGGSLLSGKWQLSTRWVSKGGVGGLILSGVLLLLFCRLVPPGTPWVYIAGVGRWLEHHFCLYIDSFLHDLFSKVQVPAMGIQLGPDKRFQAF